MENLFFLHGFAIVITEGIPHYVPLIDRLDRERVYLAQVRPLSLRAHATER